MKFFRPTIKKLNILFLLIIVCLLGIVLFAPVDVLTCPKDSDPSKCRGDWEITVEEKTYLTGEALTVKSRFEKVRRTVGRPVRSLECQNNEGIYTSKEELNTGVGDRPPGVSQAEAVLSIPEAPQVSLPTTCRISITISYPINGFRDYFRGPHYESAHSNEFRVEKAPNKPADVIIIENTPSGPRTTPLQRIAPQAPRTTVTPPSSPQSPGNSNNPPNNKDDKEDEEPTVPVCPAIDLDVRGIIGICL